jgi:hypothetical protein
MTDGPLERVYGKYRIIFRKSDHVSGRPTPHVELWKGSRKIGNYDMATGRTLYDNAPVHVSVAKFLENYLKDPQVQRKVKDAIESSFFDLSKAAGEYGGIPKGFKVEVKVEILEHDQ